MLEPTWIFAAVIVIALLLALDNWRATLLLVIPAGFLQDPLRKLAPGQPAYFLTLAASVFLLAFLSTWANGAPIRLSYLYGRDRRLERAWKVFLVLIVLQSLHTLLRYRSPIVFGLALANYLSPVGALLMGFLYAKDEQRVWRLLRLYLIFAVPCALTVYLSYWFGQDWDILKDIGSFVGREMIIYALDTVFHSYPGVFRVGEIAAWHAATASALLIMIGAKNRNPAARVAIALLVLALIGAVLLTGRRKMLMTLTLFVGFYAFFFAYFWGEMKRGTGLILVVALAATMWLAMQGDESNLFVRRGLTVFQEAGTRLSTAVDLFYSAIGREGLLGAGAGVAAQGTQYYASGADVGGAAESGIGRIVAELGLVGLGVSMWLLVAVSRYLSRLFRRVPRRLTSLTALMAGIAALVLANGATFMVATQLYGDLFILILLGLCTGFLFAGERLVGERLLYEATRRRAREARASVLAGNPTIPGPGFPAACGRHNING
jgi:hypothetical protein